MVSGDALDLLLLILFLLRYEKSAQQSSYVKDPEGIYVDAPDKSSGHRVQYIHIKYNGLGFIPLDKLLQKETA